MKLTYEGKEEYLRKVYASWLGKVIGVRLGSPVENWTHDKIMEKYPDDEGYLVDYDVYAADDDTNGPLFFIRALLEDGDITAEKIGDAFLNYLCEYHGFFWWGGVGVSTEHTAYENLKKGIKAPLSGSIETNGLTMAEQIGGQIFSDCWAYVAGYDPLLAKRLAVMASSVTHDGNGIEGGIFVAVAITLAMQRNDIHEVLEETLEYLDHDKEYYKVAKDIIAYYQNDKSDWTRCLHYIQENYGYDKYPGVCHIIPNMALMIMAMCYGDNDFDKTLIILNRSGWDTDCNCGNVGSIMGALLGLDGIDEKWIRPINDIVNSSSAIGCLNIDTVSDSAEMFTKLAYKLQGMEIEDIPMFTLPYATKGIRCNNGSIEVKDSKLYVDSKDIYTFAYYITSDLYDARYDPEFSPIVEAGDSIIVNIESDGMNKYESYILDCEGNEYTKEHEINNSGSLNIEVPSGINLTVNRIGIRTDNSYRITDIKIERKPDLSFDFRDYPLEHYGPRYGGDSMNNIRGFVKHSGEWDIDEGLVGKSNDHALISSGCYGNIYKRIEWDFTVEKGEECYVVFNMRGYLYYSALGISGNELVLIEKNKQEKVIHRETIEWKNNHRYHLSIERKENCLEVYFDDKKYEFPLTELRDLFGVYLGADCISKTYEMKLN